MVNEAFVRERIHALRLEHGISEYKMSLDLGHSKSYMQSISSGKSLPSLPEFLNICQYLNVTPKEFFDTETDMGPEALELLNVAKGLPSEDVLILLDLAKYLGKIRNKELDKI